MPTYVYYFKFTYRPAHNHPRTMIHAFPAFSAAVAWASAAAYVGAHTVNPAVTSIELVSEGKIVAVAEHENECSEARALEYLHSPRG